MFTNETCEEHGTSTIKPTEAWVGVSANGNIVAVREIEPEQGHKTARTVTVIRGENDVIWHRVPIYRDDDQDV